ncbi:MAG: hypothetical protein AAFZ10_05140 [Pseudomonadota bacterium]
MRPVVVLFVRRRPELEVVGVDAQAVVAAVAHDLVSGGDLPVQDAVDEAFPASQ